VVKSSWVLNNDMKKAQLNNLGFTIITLIAIGFLLIAGIIMVEKTNDTIAYNSASASQSISADNNSAQTLSPVGTGITSFTSATRVNNSWLSFDGTNDVVEIDNIDGYSNTKNYTVSLWLYVDTSDTTQRQGVFGHMQANGGGLHYYYETGTLQYNCDDTIYTGYVQGTINISDNNWHHIVVVVDQNTENQTIYIDNIFDNSSISDHSPVSANDVYIGRTPTPASINGFIDEVRLYNRTLSLIEIQEIYNSGRVANSSLNSTGLVLWLPLNENTGTDVHSFNQLDFT